MTDSFFNKIKISIILIVVIFSILGIIIHSLYSYFNFKSEVKSYRKILLNSFYVLNLKINYERSG